MQPCASPEGTLGKGNLIALWWSLVLLMDTNEGKNFLPLAEEKILKIFLWKINKALLRVLWAV